VDSKHIPAAGKAPALAVFTALAAALLAAPAPTLAQHPGASASFGSALHFDGTDDYVWCAPNVSGASEGTVEMWVRSPSLGTCTTIWTAGNGHPGANGDWALLGKHTLASGIAFGLFVPNDWHWAPSGEEDLPGYWTHVAGTWGPDGVKVYLDGALAGEESYTGAMSAHALELIGASAWGYCFTGTIDEVRVWNVQRSGIEIQSAMSDTLDMAVYGAAGSGLVAYYRFDELEDLGVGADGADDLRDLSASANHADANGSPTLVGGALAVESESWGRVKARYATR
jgi:hypothetical protein